MEQLFSEMQRNGFSYLFVASLEIFCGMIN